MSGPYSIRDFFEDRGDPHLCPDPENCTEHHNEPAYAGETGHHYGCECGWCQYLMWSLK